MIAWRKTSSSYEVYNVASEDWVTVDEVASIIMEVLNLGSVRRVYRPILHGVGWPGDVKKMALRIDRLKMLGFRPKLRSKEAIAITAKELLKEFPR